jgi:hypothetical protein
MSEMVERVARDLAALITEPGQHPDSQMPQCMALARAAILSMRQPTEAMIECPMARCYNYGPYGAQEVRRIFSAMIDQALKD